MKIARILESVQGIFIHNYFQQLLIDAVNELENETQFCKIQEVK